MGRLQDFFKRYRWAILSGLMMGTSYIPLPPWALVFCWVPLWWDLLTQTKTPHEAFLKGWWTQFVLTLIGFYWISYVAHEFGYLPWPVAILILLLFAALVHLYIPLAASAVVYLRNRFQIPVAASLVLLATFHNLGETYWPSVFSWNLGYPLLWIRSGWAQWADIVGFLGLSYGVHLLNALLAWLWIQKNSRKTAQWLIPVAVVLLITFVTGNWRAEKWEQAPGEQVKSLVVQANVGNLEKAYAERGQGYQVDIIDKYFRLSNFAIQEHPDVELLIFPETAIPDFLDDHNRSRRYAQLFFQNLKLLNRPILTGGFSNDPPGKTPIEEYNALFLIGPEGQNLDLPYHKTNLLMYGEYVPFGDVFPILKKWNPGGEGFGRGSGPVVMTWGAYKIGPQICYESLDPSFTRASVQKGADLLVNITNDSWFGPHFEPEQHLFMTLARAIEVRRPLIRSTNTGVSTAIEASGKIHPLSPKGQEWAGVFDVKVQKDAPLTFYAQYGGVLPFILLIVVGLVLWRHRRGSSRLARNS